MCCRATVVYDRSPEFFRPINLREKHEVSLVFLLDSNVSLSDVFSFQRVQRVFMIIFVFDATTELFLHRCLRSVALSSASWEIVSQHSQMVLPILVSCLAGYMQLLLNPLVYAIAVGMVYLNPRYKWAMLRKPILVCDQTITACIFVRLYLYSS